MATSPTAGLLR